MSCISLRNTARGSTKPSCFLGSCTAAFWPVAAFAVPRTLSAVWSAFCETTIPGTLIRTAGLTQVSRSCVTHRSAVHDASNIMDGPGLTHVRSALRGCSIRLGLTVDELLNL